MSLLYFRVDERGQNKMTPLHYAARYGKIGSAQGGTREASKSEKTWKAIAFLMKHSNEKNAKDKYGFTVLHHAVYRGNTLAVQRLIEGKEVAAFPPKKHRKTQHIKTDKKLIKNVKVRADEVDEQGNTALHLAAQGDHKEVCIHTALPSSSLKHCIG